MKCKILNQLNWRVFLLSIIVVFFIASAGSFFTSPQVNSDWYESIRPEITPPSYVFPIVWNILFLMISISLYIAWVNSEKKEKIKIIIIFGVNLFLNFLWSFLYFGLMNPKLAFFELIALWLSIILLIVVVYKIKKIAAYLLIPYFLWVSFAGYLNFLSF